MSTMIIYLVRDKAGKNHRVVAYPQHEALPVLNGGFVSVLEVCKVKDIEEKFNKIKYWRRVLHI